jgi:hypothetical protein
VLEQTSRALSTGDATGERRHGGQHLYTCGDFVDDYAVDEIERNDQSFIFALDCDGVCCRGCSSSPRLSVTFRPASLVDVSGRRSSTDGCLVH